MQYGADLTFVNSGYSENADTQAVGRMFGYYGIQFLRSGKMFACTGSNPREYAEEPAVFITFPGVPFHYGSPENATREQVIASFDSWAAYAQGTATIHIVKKMKDQLLEALK